jgi:D-alanine--D-alanine ligase
MRRTRVGVLRGGRSSAYDVSINTGNAVLNNLSDEFEPIDIFIDQYGNWYVSGIKQEPKQAFKKVDVIFNAMHGEFGEDGQIQELLQKFGVPHTGSSAFPSRLAINKGLAKKVFENNKIKTPLSKIIKKPDYNLQFLLDFYNSFPQPSVVKPISGSVSVGINLATNRKELAQAFEEAFAYDDKVLVEEFIPGKEVASILIEDFNGQKYYSLPAVEIRPKSVHKIFNFNSKHNGDAEFICPSSIDVACLAEINRLSTLIHKTLDLRHYSKSDFIINPKRGIYLLEVNTLPSLDSDPTFSHALRNVGLSLSDFLSHIIKRALQTS